MSLALSRFVSLLFFVAFALFVGMTVDNVYSELPPIKALAEAAACKVKDCTLRHQFTRVDRAFDGQVVTLQWESGSVTVTCGREHFVYGSRVCTAK